jgi:steroid delta-isomerase-like uncharacterized protein
MTESTELCRRWFEEVWNRGQRDAIGEMLAPEAPIHEGSDTMIGADGFYPFFDRMQSAFSKIRVTVHDTIAEGDRVCVRWSCSMTHTGDSLGMPPTGKQIAITGISIIRVADGQMAEGWQNWDMLGLMEQIRGVEKSPTYIAAARA